MKFEFRNLLVDEALVGVEKCGRASYISILPLRRQAELIAQDIEDRGGRMEVMAIDAASGMAQCAGCEVCGIHARIGSPHRDGGLHA